MNIYLKVFAAIMLLVVAVVMLTTIVPSLSSGGFFSLLALPFVVGGWATASWITITRIFFSTTNLKG